MSTFAAGLLITILTVALELLEHDYKKEQKRFEESY